MQCGDLIAKGNEWFKDCIHCHNSIQHQQRFMFIIWFNALKSLGKIIIDRLFEENLHLFLIIQNWSSSGDYWGWVTYICINNLTSIGSDNDMLPGWCQAIIESNDGILLLGPLVTNFCVILIEIHKFSFRKIYLNIVCEMAVILSNVIVF